MRLKASATAIALLLLLPGAPGQDPAAAGFRAVAGQRPNFVVILTDDQRWDSLWAMPFVERTLRRRSVDFRNAYVTTPVCCPARASFLSGGFFAHNTGVLTNSGPNGGATRFDDRRSLPLQLYRAGYRTALVDKYMNDYQLLAPWIPAGWSHFVGSVQSHDWFDFEVAIGSGGTQGAWGRRENRSGEHIVEFELREALRFLEQVREPFFLLVSLEAPHEPAAPAHGDAQLHPGYEYRGRSWGEEDLSDKPRFLRRRARDFERETARNDRLHVNQLRSLALVDRGVEAIVELLARRGQLESTVIVFTSDNGYLWGEHRMEGKNLPYEEAIRVPLLIARPGTPAGTEDRLVAMNLDVPATILDLAGIHRNPRVLARHTDGSSLRPLLDPLGPAELDWRQELLIEGFNRVWAGLLRLRPGEGDGAAEAGWFCKYVRTERRAEEFYRSDSDPLEMESLHRTRQFRREDRDELSQRLAELRGLAITTRFLPPGRVGADYRKQIEAVGRSEPYVWSIESGALPGGLRLDPERGAIVGRPTEAGTFRFGVRVEGSALARYTGLPQAYVDVLELTIRP